jgi:hypothetical protein
MWTSLKDGWVACCEIWRPDRSRPDVQVKLDEWALDEFVSSGGVLHPLIAKEGRGTHVRFDAFKARGQFHPDSMLGKLSRRWFTLPVPVQVEADHGSMFKDPGKGQAVTSGWNEWKNRAWNVGSLGTALEDVTTIAVSPVPLTGAVARAYVLPKTSDALDNKHYSVGLFTHDKNKKAKAATGVMLEGEVYSFFQGGGAHNRLKGFGVTHGASRVVLLIEASPASFVPNDKRTGLEPCVSNTVEEAQVPWDLWADEFRAAMPDELRSYVRENMFGSEAECYDRLRDWYLSRLKKIRVRGAVPGDPAGKRGDAGSGKPKRRKRRDVMGHFWPKLIEWVSFAADDPSRNNVGAWFSGPSMLQLNADWPRLRKTITQLVEEHGLPEEDAIEIVRQAYVTQVVDVISKSIYESEPEPSPAQLAFGVLMPSGVARTIDDVKALIGYVTA